jgi:hypothetical protein
MKTKQMMSILLFIMALVCSGPLSAQTYIMTDAGLDRIKLGMHYKQLPQQITALYDKIKVEKDGVHLDDPTKFEGYSISLTLKGDTWISLGADKSGLIESITVFSKNVKVKIGNRLVGIGTKFSSLSSIPGATTPIFGETHIGKFVFQQDIGMEEAIDSVSYFFLSK